MQMTFTESAADQAKVIRSCNLDVLFIGTNVTAVSNSVFFHTGFLQNKARHKFGRKDLDGILRATTFLKFSMLYR